MGKNGRINRRLHGCEVEEEIIGHKRKGGDGTRLLVYCEPVLPESPQSSWSLGLLSYVDRKQDGHGKYSGDSQSS